MPVTSTCETCGATVTSKPSRPRRFCSRKCRSALITRSIRADGYVMLSGAGLNTLEHRYIVEQQIGRTLGPDENVHHINGIKHDNRPENLELTTRGDHIRDHHAKVRDPSRWVAVHCTQCGVAFDRRVGEFVKFSKWFCSRECYLKNHAAKIARRVDELPAGR